MWAGLAALDLLESGGGGGGGGFFPINWLIKCQLDPICNPVRGGAP